MNIVCVIPARMASSRFPGKPLAKLAGRPMIEHVYRRAAMCKALSKTLIATCDEEIAEATRAFGGEAIMTSPSHERASDRVAEVAESVPADIYLMVQGDEPLIVPEMLDLAIAPMLRDPAIGCVNLAARILTDEERNDRNTIKVTMDLRGNALYFSRAPISLVKQVCVIPFRKDALKAFKTLPPTPLEQQESIDMLRFLEHGHSVRMVMCDHDTHAVDTPEDLALVERMLNNR